MKSCLTFNENPLNADELDELLIQFRDQGFVIVKNVFDRETVDQFRSDVLDALVTSEKGTPMPPDDSPLTIWPATAPRIRQLLSPALSHSKSSGRLPILYSTSWHISDETEAHYNNEQWHRDIDPDGTPGKEYHYPREVHVGMYFTDMTEQNGATEVVPGSHGDPLGLSPYRKNAPDTKLFLCQKEDVVLWDQRLWHRATRRTIPGHRVFAVFGFFAAPALRHRPRPMSTIQHKMWLDASNEKERIFFGGPFSPEQTTQ